MSSEATETPEGDESGACALAEEVAKVLVKATLALGRAGQPVEASRLAAEGFAAVRRDCPRAAQRLNNVLHTLANLPGHELPGT